MFVSVTWKHKTSTSRGWKRSLKIGASGDRNWTRTSVGRGEAKLQGWTAKERHQMRPTGHNCRRCNRGCHSRVGPTTSTADATEAAIPEWDQHKCRRCNRGYHSRVDLYSHSRCCSTGWEIFPIGAQIHSLFRLLYFCDVWGWKPLRRSKQSACVGCVRTVYYAYIFVLRFYVCILYVGHELVKRGVLWGWHEAGISDILENIYHVTLAPMCKTIDHWKWSLSSGEDIAVQE